MATMKSIMILLTIFAVACTNRSKLQDSTNDEKKSINEESARLIGTWELDSVSTPDGGYKNPDSTDHFNKIVLTLKKDSSYKLSTQHDSHTGKYFVLYNPKRGYNSLILLQDIELWGEDTFRHSVNLDIVNVSESRLQVVGESELHKHGPYNRQFIYRRTK